MTWSDKPRRSGGCVIVSIVMLLAVLILTGCQSSGQYVESFDGGREKMELDAYDIVLTMRQAGFNDEQILKHGPSLRNALAIKGAARIFGDQSTQAIFMIQDGEIYAVSQRHGSFRYRPEREAFREVADTFEVLSEAP
jgi:hypothetical protein